MQIDNTEPCSDGLTETAQFNLLVNNDSRRVRRKARCNGIDRAEGESEKVNVVREVIHRASSVLFVVVAAAADLSWYAIAHHCQSE